MPYFRAKNTKFDLTGEAHGAPPDPLAGFKKSCF